MWCRGVGFRWWLLLPNSPKASLLERPLGWAFKQAVNSTRHTHHTRLDQQREARRALCMINSREDLFQQAEGNQGRKTMDHVVLSG